MRPTHLFSAIVLVLGLTGLQAACDKKPKKTEDQSADLGFKVIPTGENPARAPGPKGTMIELANTEVKIVLIRPGGPADLNGFMADDVILAAAGKEVHTEEQLAEIIAKNKDKKIIIELRRGRQLYTLPLTTDDPGWIVLSGDTFKGFLLTRIQAGKKKTSKLPVGSRAPQIRLPAFSAPSFELASLKNRPVALIFWGTFSEPCYAHLQALDKACTAAKDSVLACVAIDTMELFTAVGKTKDYQAEMLKVHKTIWPKRPLPVDLFMQSERNFGISKLPTLVLIDSSGHIHSRIDGPMKDPIKDTSAAIQALLSDGD
jgi:thiol-disulfide isomerase/thioredoxin